MFIKKFLPVLFSAVVLLFSCQYLNKDEQVFLPGIYTNYAEGDYSVAWDTLFVQRIGDKQNAYRISRRTAFQRKLSGTPPIREQRKETWTAVYDAGRKVLTIPRTGREIRIYPDSGIIVVGSRRYQKLEK